jgi:hypothetical protein
MSPVPIDTSDLEYGDIVLIHSDVLGEYRAMFIEHSMETAGAIWVRTRDHRLLIGADGRLLVSSRMTLATKREAAA